MTEKSWRKVFVDKLLNLSDEYDAPSAIKLIKCHEKNLAVNGDFSCPGKKDIWQKVLKSTNCNNLVKHHDDREDLQTVAELLVSDVPELMLKTVKVNPNGYLIFWMDRYAFIQNFFNAFNSIDLHKKNEVKVNVAIENIDKCELTSARCDQVSRFANRLLKCHIVQHNAVTNFLRQIIE